MRRRFAAYGFDPLDPLSRSTSAPATVTAGGLLASALTGAGRTLTTTSATRGLTPVSPSAGVYTPSGGLGTEYTRGSVLVPFSVVGATALPDTTPYVETTPDYLRLSPTVIGALTRGGTATPSGRAVSPTVTGALTRPTSPTVSGRGPVPGILRATTVPGVRSTPLDIPIGPTLTLDTSASTTTDTTTDTSVPTTSETSATTDTYYTVPTLDTRAGIGEYWTGGPFARRGYMVPVMPGGAPVVRQGMREAKKPVSAAPTPEAGGFPWGWLLLAAGVGTAFVIGRKKKGTAP